MSYENLCSKLRSTPYLFVDPRSQNIELISHGRATQAILESEAVFLVNLQANLAKLHRRIDGNTDRQFTTRDISLVSGIDRGQASRMFQRGVFVAARGASRKKKKYYNFAEAFIAATSGMLWRHGLSVKLTQAVARTLREAAASKSELAVSSTT